MGEDYGFDYSDLNNLIAEKPLYYNDYKTQKYYQILEFEMTDENDTNTDVYNCDYFVTRRRIEIDPNTLEQTGAVISETIRLGTLYEYDQALGGA